MASKKREIYARVATQLRTHDRARLAEKTCPGAMGLYLFLLLQARGEQTQGCASEEAAWESWSAPISYRKKQAEALILVGLVARLDGRLHVVKYDEHNDTPADIEQAKEKARVRMHNVRERNACSGDVRRTLGERSPDVPSSISSSLSGSGSREGEPEREADGSLARYQEAYAIGISRGKCGSWVWPGTKYADWDLGKIISGHACDANKKGYRGAQLLRFIEHTACEFASQVIESRKAQYYFAFEPRGCLKWLNEADLAEEARRVG